MSTSRSSKPSRHRRFSRKYVFVGAVLSFLPACVSQGKYDGALAKIQALEKQARDQNADEAGLKARLGATEAAMVERDRRLAEQAEASEALRTKLDEATALNEQIRDELTRAGRNVDRLASDKGATARALEDARKRLAELRRAQAAAEQRAALYRDLALKFHTMIDAGELAIALRDGRMVLQLPNDVLFDSGKATLKATGQQTLRQIAGILMALPKRKLQIAGHTDNDPISVSHFASNWELSTVRALEVVQFLVKAGMAPTVLSASGYGEFDPVVANDSPAGKAKNRRIEITLVPNIDELVVVPTGGAS